MRGTNRSYPSIALMLSSDLMLLLSVKQHRRDGCHRGGEIGHRRQFCLLASAACFRIGAQRAISEHTVLRRYSGPRSDFGGTVPPSLPSFSAVAGSSNALLSASASLAIISFGVPFGASLPLQMV